MNKHKTGVASGSKIRFQESEDYVSSSEEEIEIERELADVTFEELQKARSDGTLSLNLKSKLEKKTGRANKNRPAEMSSKKPVSRFREVIQVPKKTSLDPRFETLCGTLDPEGFRKRYDFMFNEHLPTEKAELQKLLKKSTDPEVVEDLRSRLGWIDKQLKSGGSTRNTETQILTEHKKKEREAAKHGKKPFYLKKSEIRKQRLLQKYDSLKATGQLDSYIEKRRKRNAAKDHRFMPYRRSENEQ